MSDLNKRRDEAMTIPAPWRLWVALTIPFWLLIIGAVCYRYIEGPTWTWEDAIYMSAITLTTVGYGETHTLSSAGRWFTIAFLFGGVFTLFYTATEIIRYVVSGQIQQALGRERMERALSHLQDHVIVCGLGRMGRLVCQDFEKQDVPFVVVDRNPALLNAITYKHGIPLQGDSTTDEVLLHAGVERARALIAALPSDADNLYIVLSARVLNEKINIVARAEEEAAIAKLRRVGANHIIAPYAIGGHRASQAVLKPAVGHFLDLASQHDVDYVVEEILVEAGSSLCGKTLRQSRLHEEFGVVVLTIKNLTGDMSFNPQGDSLLEAGHILIVVGHRGQMMEVKNLGRAKEK
jgi:voltage-gated potassium channel